jgi:hypothetical protein
MARAKKTTKGKTPRQFAQPDQTALARFWDIVKDIEWSNINEIRSLCKDADLWDDNFNDRAEEKAEKADIRRMMRLLKEEGDNFPLFGNLVVATEDGRSEHIYKPIAKFTFDDHQQVVDVLASEMDYKGDLILGHDKRCKAKYGKQLSFYFKHDVKLKSKK